MKTTMQRAKTAHIVERDWELLQPESLAEGFRGKAIQGGTLMRWRSQAAGFCGEGGRARAGGALVNLAMESGFRPECDGKSL